MADTKISELTADASPSGDDLLVTVNDPGGTPGTRKVTLANVLDFIEANGAAPASFISSGTLANARVAEANVTQHEAALTITESQISDLGTYQAELSEGAFANGDKTKLDGIEASADVTDAANVTAALDGASLTDLGTPASGDLILLQDASDSNILKVAQFSTFGGAGDAWSDAVDANIVPDGDGTRDLGSDATRFDQGYVDELHVTEGAILSEAADHPITPAAGKGQLWVSNDVTQKLYFTDDAGTDKEVAFLTGGTELSDPGADRLLFWDDSATSAAWLTAGSGLSISATTMTVDFSGYQAEPSEGAFADGDKTKLDGIESSADVTDAANVETSIEAITLSSVSGATGDEVLIIDATDGGLKAVLWENLPGSGGGISNVVEDTTPQLGGNLDGQGNEVANYTNAVVTSVSGTLTTAAHSGNVIVTSGNVTVPTTAGFTCTLIAGGAHTVSFNSTTSAAMASGDVMTVVVEDSTTIHAVLTEAANKVGFT